MTINELIEKLNNLQEKGHGDMYVMIAGEQCVHMHEGDINIEDCNLIECEPNIDQKVIVLGYIPLTDD